ncbi:MAG: SPOR domain-containing protein [Gammaproteobacteria bacterium]|jgi:cell division septation protein DedD|tara:strand:- start:3754 stop:4170 length:417 start_codon:yes stop_codon:yes gene_type:complete
MRLERIVGLFFISALLIFLMFIFYPKDLSNNNTADPIKAKKIEIEVTKDENFNEFVETDFDFFVYRAHVLSSKKNADILKNEIEEGGYPAFIENLENNNNLFVLYVGPFLSESDIVNNMGDIQSLSQSNNGEIVRWKL